MFKSKKPKTTDLQCPSDFVLADTITGIVLPGVVARVKAHLSVCPRCVRRAKLFHANLALIRKFPD